MSKAREPPAGQQTISSFFSKGPSSKKRKSSPIDLTGNDDDDSLSPKKKKTGEVIQSTSILDSTTSDHPLARFSYSERSQSRADKITTSPPLSSDSAAISSTDSLSFREKLRRREFRRKIRASPFVNVEEGNVSQEDRTKRGKGEKSSVLIGPAGLPCTPLEVEVIKFKKVYPDIVLLIEVGYKYCFFGNDAKVGHRALQIVGEVLGFGYGQTNNFLRTSFPLHNLKVNAKKLVAAGHKVGVISQMETAALKKAGDNRNSLFNRKLTQLFTPATFVDDLDSREDIDDFGQATPPLMCLVEMEKGSSHNDKVILAFVSFTPSTGDMIYDEFEDFLLRTELETRLMHIRPCELLLPERLSIATEKVLRHFSEGSRVRVERLKLHSNYTEAFETLVKFYAKESDSLVAGIAGLPNQVIIALAMVVKHLSAFELSDGLLEAKFFTKFTARTQMILSTRTLNNLEIYRNQTDGTERGTLFSAINQTKTMFGKRLLKSWVCRPLVDKTILQQRIDAIEEARTGDSAKLVLLREVLKGLPDLARGLCSIQYGRCNPKELAIILKAFDRIGAAFPAFANPSEVGCSSVLWTDIIYALPKIHPPLKDILSSINWHRARADDKENLWNNPDRFPALADCRLSIMTTESDLAEELKKVRRLLKMPSLNYVCVGSTEFLIEIPKARASIVPREWSRLGSTPKVLRYHSPEIIKLLEEREQHKERFQAEVQDAYRAFLREIAQHYAPLRDVVNKLAIADCLMSLATVSFDENLCKPHFIDKCSLRIIQGRHPVIEQLRADPFVPNDISLGGDHPRNLVISGPNMGGKSSLVRMTAILVILAQIGSYVPAKHMTLGIHDSILTRMGASDDLAAGRSTFMVELAETRQIIQSATAKSLVILDELGRGTSTFDGMAIADAVLEYLSREIKCKTLFITHYPTIARELEALYPRDISNVHMSFVEHLDTDGRREIRFLYKLANEISSGSYGIECARLAGIPDAIIQEASQSSENMQKLLERKGNEVRVKKVLQLMQVCIETRSANAAHLDELKIQMKLMGL